MGHVDKRIWEYLRLSRTSDGSFFTTNPGVDSRGQLSVVRSDIGGDGLYLTRLAPGGLAYQQAIVLFNGDDITSLVSNLSPDGFVVGAAGALTTRTLAAGANIAITNPAGTAGNPSIALNANPEVNSLIVDGLIRWGAVNGTPVITFAAGAGTGPSLTSYTGGDYAGKLIFKTGTTPAAGAQVNIAFQTALANANYGPSAMSFGSAGASVQPYISAQATTGWTLAFNVAPGASTTYQFEVRIAGR